MRQGAQQRIARAVVLVSLSFAIPACSLINRARGITENYRYDGLGVLRIRVVGPGMCCTTSSRLVAPAESVLVTIRKPGGGSTADSLVLLTDVSGEALFEGIDPGSYELVIRAVGFLVPFRSSVRVPMNARIDVTYNLNNMGFTGKDQFRSTPRR